MKLTSILALLLLNICCEISISYSATIREKRDAKQDSLTNANALLSEASKVAKELSLQNRTQEAQTIESLANTTKSVVEKLNATANQSEINELSAKLLNSETELLTAFQRVVQSSHNYSELAKLLQQNGNLYLWEFVETVVKANRELANFRQQNKTSAVLRIENSLKLINESVNELRNLTLMHDVYRTETKIIHQFTQLEIDLYELGVYGWDLADIRDVYITKAIVLRKQLTAAVNRTKTDVHFGEQRRNETITTLELFIDALTALTSQLYNATDNNTIAELTFNLSEFEYNTESVLTVLLSETVSEQEVQAMLHKIQELSSKVLVAKEKLVAEHKNTEAESLNDELIVLTDFQIAIKNTVYPLDFMYFEMRFAEIEARINNKLKAAIVY